MKNKYKPHLVKVIRKRTSVGRDLKDGLRLDRNERVIDFPQKVIEDIYKCIPKYTFSAYPSPDNLYKKLSIELGMPAERIYITNAITEAIRIVFETLVSPQDKVVTISPTYPMYKVYSEIFQARLHTVGFREDLSLGIKELHQAINKDTCLVCLPNPNLPIETALSLDDIRFLADKCKECGAVFVIDEAYAFFGISSAVELIEEYDNLVIFRTFSKAFGLAGIRLGYMVSNEENIEYLSKTRSLVESNGISMFIGEYMLDHPEIMEEYVQAVKEGAEYVKKELSKLCFRYFGGKVTNGLLIFLDSKEQTEELLSYLNEKKIYIRGSFDSPLDNCLRLTIGPKAVMIKFIEALSEWRKTVTIEK